VTACQYAAPILDKIDPSNYIMYRLYRDATRYESGTYLKDLSRLNRDLSKVLVLETDPSRVSQPENVIQLAPWKGDLSDRELLAYLPFLESKPSSP
jgi:import inner membrane translocase subunit TIM50